MGSGGIRLGAGRPRKRLTIESALAIDVRKLQRDACLIPGNKLKLQWSWPQSDSNRTASMGIAVGDHELTLKFSVDGVPHEQRIHLDYTSCHFGGNRPWILCPRCARRQALIYYGRHRFACRTCNDLAYRTQQLDPIDRSWRKQRNIEAKMGGEGAWKKPKGMHDRTWQCLRHQLNDCEEMRLEAACKFLLRVMPNKAQAR